MGPAMWIEQVYQTTRFLPEYLGLIRVCVGPVFRAAVLISSMLLVRKLFGRVVGDLTKTLPFRTVPIKIYFVH